ncbi:MAG: hypothetical protein S4CHLAM6_03270 [Chlamydiae bacterium]|nr:hypothetical protein [Chlamydiota bacterium]
MLYNNFKYVWLIVLTQVFFVSFCFAGIDDQLVDVNITAGKSVEFTDIVLTEFDFTGGVTTYDYSDNTLTWQYDNTDGTAYALHAGLNSAAETGWTYTMTLGGIGTTSGAVTFNTADGTTAKEVATALPVNTIVTNGTQDFEISVLHANFTGGVHNNTFLFTFI